MFPFRIRLTPKPRAGDLHPGYAVRGLFLALVNAEPANGVIRMCFRFIFQSCTLNWIGFLICLVLYSPRFLEMIVVVFAAYILVGHCLVSIC